MSIVDNLAQETTAAAIYSFAGSDLRTAELARRSNEVSTGGIELMMTAHTAALLFALHTIISQIPVRGLCLVSVPPPSPLFIPLAGSPCCLQKRYRQWWEQQ